MLPSIVSVKQMSDNSNRAMTVVTERVHVERETLPASPPSGTLSTSGTVLTGGTLSTSGTELTGGTVLTGGRP